MVNLLIVKNILNKVNVSSWTILYIFLFLLSGLFKEFISLSILIFFHELGHILASSIFKWEITKIEIFPFGGNIKFTNTLNKPLIEEFLIAMSGIVFQSIIFLLLRFFITDTYFIKVLTQYHYTLFWFNLLPIFPLDGSKLLECISHNFFNVKNTIKIQVLISLISILFLVITFYYNYSFIAMLIFLFVKNITYLKNVKYSYQKFLFDKYKLGNKSNKEKQVDSINKLYRNKVCFIKYKDKYVKEKIILSNLFG